MDHGDLEQAAAAAAATAAADRQATADLPEHTHGSDAAGAVTVTVDAAGHVVRVAPVNTWQDRVGGDGFGPAITEAIQAAAGQRLQTWLDARQEALRSTQPAVAPAPPPPQATMRGFPDGTEIEALVAAAAALREGAAEAAVTPAATTVSDDRGVVTVEVVSGAVSRVSVDAAWAERSPLGTIVTTLQQAFDRAAAAEPAPVPDVLAGLPPAARSLVDDPLGMFLGELSRLADGSTPS